MAVMRRYWPRSSRRPPYPLQSTIARRGELRGADGIATESSMTLPTSNEFIWSRCASSTLVVFWSQTISWSLFLGVWFALACRALASPCVCLLPLHQPPPCLQSQGLLGGKHA